jgi:hypothetical protein
MDLAPATAAAGPASGRCIARANRLVRVKFIALPVEPAPEYAPGETRAPGGSSAAGAGRHPGAGRGPIIQLLFRVIGRLVAARP